MLGAYEIGQVHQADSIGAMAGMPQDGVDLVIADPPYNVSHGGKWEWSGEVDLPGFGGKWRKHMEEWDQLPLGSYIEFTLAWLTQVKRVLKPSGSLWVHGTYHNIGLVNFALQALDIEIINEVIWYKRNSFPNLSGRRLTASHETILWAHVGQQREYYFDYELAKRMDSGPDQLKKPGKQLRTVWDIPNNKRREELAHGKHPAQKPIRLLERMISLSSLPDSLCLAPFSGAGSTCVAARRLGRSFIGFELDPEYVAISRERLEAGSAQQLEVCL